MKTWQSVLIFHQKKTFDSSHYSLSFCSGETQQQESNQPLTSVIDWVGSLFHDVKKKHTASLAVYGISAILLYQSIITNVLFYVQYGNLALLPEIKN